MPCHPFRHDHDKVRTGDYEGRNEEVRHRHGNSSRAIHRRQRAIRRPIKAAAARRDEGVREVGKFGQCQPLADFRVASFSGPDMANGSLPPVSSANAIQMADPWGQWANPSLASVPNFNVCWAFETFTPC